jgi:hypothetical protein
MRFQKLTLSAAAILLLAGCSAPAVTAPAADPADSAAPAEEAAASRTVVYEVTSDAGTAGNVTYLTFNNGGSGQEQATEAPLPFSKTIDLEDDGMFESSIFSLTAQASADATTISCKITADGKVVAEQTSTGQYAVVSCSGSSS